MSDLYYKYGILLEDDIFLATSTATTGVTGQAANLELTLMRSGAGIATTGVTFTEVLNTTTGLTLYHVSASATTSFAATTGEVSAVVQWTSDRNYTFSKTYRLTSDGLPSGSAGTASFTATANDGRVTDGTTPLEGATIFFRTPGSLAPYITLTTDSSGLWGPIFFPSNGTWPFFIQLAGYSEQSSSILVSGSTATGPAADIALTAIGSASGLLLSSLKTYARFQVRGNVGTAADAMIVSAINDALGELSRAFRWSWLKTDGGIISREPFTDGTITLTEGDATVTLAGGTWPTYAATGQLLIGGIYYKVASRTNGTVIELEDEYAGTTESGVGYTMYFDEYDLPSDCMIFGKMFPCMGFGWKPDPISFESLREYQASNNFNAPNPGFIAIQNGKMILWPAPSTTRNYPCIYYRRPATLVNNTDEADWDPLQLTVLQRAIDVQLAIRWTTILHGDVATCQKNYEKCLSLAINNERENAQRAGTGQAPRRVTVADMTIPGGS
jgi:hypothetical protein